MVFPKIKATDRVFYVGQTGTGKSTLAGMVLSTSPRLIAIDTVGDLEDQFTNMEEWTKGRAARLRSGKLGRLVIHRPSLDEDDIPDWFESIAHEVMKIGNVQLYIDEANNVVPSRMLRKYALSLFSQGRHYKVGTHISSQRPSLIQKSAITEAQHFFIFRLIDPDDQLKIKKMIGFYEYPPDEHGFFWFHIGDEPVYYPFAQAVPMKSIPSSEEEPS